MKTWRSFGLVATFVALTAAIAVAGDPQPDAKTGVAEVEWKKFDAALQLAGTGQKHIMVDVYTDWCGWCKKLDAETYSDPEVRKVLAESYVSSKVKGDSDGPLSVKGVPKVEGDKTMIQFITTDQPETTEKQLARGHFRVTGYPTILFLASDGRMITKLSGFQNAEAFKNILNFIKDDLYEVMSYQDYLKSIQLAESGGK